MIPEYTNTVKAEWLPDGREMRLLEEVKYIDSSGIEWVAPVGSIVDGASIPRFFWRLVGGPYSGKFRRATVLHDVYCKTKSRPHSAVHKMFHEAMLADGEGKTKASTMYNAVAMFGPKWTV